MSKIEAAGCITETVIPKGNIRLDSKSLNNFFLSFAFIY